MRAALARIEGAVGKGETVNLVGFGRFEVYEEDSGHQGSALQNRQAPAGCRCRIETQARRER